MKPQFDPRPPTTLPDGGIWVHPVASGVLAWHLRSATEALAKGKRRRGTISPAWYERGGLVCDSDGIAVLDADGQRHRLDIPPRSVVVTRRTHGINTGSSAASLDVYTREPEVQAVIHMPLTTGLVDAVGLGAWCTAAELDQAFAGDFDTRYSGRHGAPTIQWRLDWQQDAEQRGWEATRLHLFGRSKADPTT